MAILNRIQQHMVRKSFRARVWIRGEIFLWLMLAFLGVPSFRAESQAQAFSREYALKAVFLLNFAQFTAWPTNSFPETNSPFIVGVLGDDPFGPVLDETLRSENWNGHPFVIRRLASLDEAALCHLVFVCRSEIKKLPAISRQLRGRPILTVGDFENVGSPDIAIRLVNEKNRIRFKVNLELLKDSRLNVSSKLLRVADMETTENR